MTRAEVRGRGECYKVSSTPAGDNAMEFSTCWDFRGERDLCTIVAWNAIRAEDMVLRIPDPSAIHPLRYQPVHLVPDLAQEESP